MIVNKWREDVFANLATLDKNVTSVQMEENWDQEVVLVSELIIYNHTTHFKCVIVIKKRSYTYLFMTLSSIAVKHDFMIF